MKKKIVFLVHGMGLGGVEKILLEILDLIDKSKFDIKLIINNQEDNILEEKIPKEISYIYLTDIILNKKIKNINKKSILKILGVRSLLKKYREYLSQKRYVDFTKDRELIVDFSNGYILKKLKLREKQKKICWIHGNPKNVYNLQEKNKNLKVSQELNQYNKIICICNEMKKEFLNFFPALSDKFQVIYNPFNIEKIKEMAKDNSGLSEKEKKLLKEDYMIMVARLDIESKDFVTLIKAYKKYGLKVSNSKKLYLLGDGADKEKIGKIIKNENLGEKIILLGGKKNPYPWIKNSSLFILSSFSEGLPTVLIEALILKRVIISTKCKTGPKEILNDGKYGELIPVGDIEKMSEVIIELDNIKSLRRKEIEENIREKECIERFNGKSIIKKIEKLFEGI